MMTLLTLLGVALLSLSAVELRGSSHGDHQAMARTNARLALMSAVGQLQRELGPDQRVTAQADLLDPNSDRHWTGVWSSVDESGASIWQRDPELGGWTDARSNGSWSRESAVRKWLVSGDASPGSGAERVELLGDGSVETGEEVTAPLVEIEGTGRLAWWTGDLSVRANLSVADRHADADAEEPGRATYRRMLAQQAEETLIGDGIEFGSGERERLVSTNTVGLVGGDEWTKRHFHDFTVNSKGVLADVRDGGLKGDLSAFFESDGSVPSLDGMVGLADQDSLLLDVENSRHQSTAPRMGLLRDWVRSAVPYSGNNVASVVPETDTSGGGLSEKLALCNESPTRLRSAIKSSLQPVLVEASNYLQISTYQLTPLPRPSYQLRHHLYPRVVLWNPYNVELRFDSAIVMLQTNGRQEMWTDSEQYDEEGNVDRIRRSQWLSFEGGRSTNFVPDFRKGQFRVNQTEGYNDPYMGSYYFTIPETTFGPGECLVFSPRRSAEYDGLSAYRPGPYNLAANMLSCEVAPDPSRSFYVSGSDIDKDGAPFRPIRFWYAPTPAWSFDGRGVVNQGDDTRVVMKHLGDVSTVTFEVFDSLPQLAYISASLQYGAGREPRVSWNDQRPMDVELLDPVNPRPTLDPDVRTREGIRLRWFDEHLSNIVNSGALAADSHFFEEALFATWNPRATYAVRSPWENLGGSMPTGGRTGSGGGPWFFGAYTRDLYDELVSFNEQVPVFREGRYHGNPFGPPQEGQTRHTVFELPRSETGVISLGQLQHAKLSDLVWHPSFAIGNSLVDPRLGLEGMTGTIPRSDSEDEHKLGGFHRNAIGWSSDAQRSSDREAWAEQARALLQDIPDDDHLVYDLSYEANQGLWDRFFVSSGDAGAKAAFIEDPDGKPLPNGRMVLAGSTRSELTSERIADFHQAAYHLLVDGAFNVNSTRVEAWKAMLAATRDTELGTSFSRMLEPVEGSHGEDDPGNSDSGWAGSRVLQDDEIERLAVAIVDEVRKRGPFLSLADFVNRRLADDETGRTGALQAAIDRAGPRGDSLNQEFLDDYPLNNEDPIRDYTHPDNIQDSTRLEQTLKPSSKAWGAAGFLTQGDLLQPLAPVLTARSDTFVIRAYGDVVDSSGDILARAWCEAEVQRTPVPIDPDRSGLNPRRSSGSPEFGRRFEIVSFRWLKPEEV
ncbi:hypothetical protein [Haloferula rosea]|uniref:Uncharacterized protein n=1 Tax=Haloferula rosea TaxID=490093 RepID=A0A934R557_9BACT|nr:hypothetical protein [Haloferula rosea]MBK1825494.1 hypothetical protein [Haloferula rosea]